MPALGSYALVEITFVRLQKRTQHLAGSKGAYVRAHRGFLQFGCLRQWPQAVLRMLFWRYDCLLVWPESMQVLKS